MTARRRLTVAPDEAPINNGENVSARRCRGRQVERNDDRIDQAGGRPAHGYDLSLTRSAR